MGMTKTRQLPVEKQEPNSGSHCVAAALNSLGQAIELLADQIKTNAERITPILRQEEKTCEDAVKAHTLSEVPLVNVIEEHTAKVILMAAMMRSVNERNAL